MGESRLNVEHVACCFELNSSLYLIDEHGNIVVFLLSLPHSSPFLSCLKVPLSSFPAYLWQIRPAKLRFVALVSPVSPPKTPISTFFLSAFPHSQLIDLQSNSLVHDLSGSPFPLFCATLLDDVLLCLDTANHLVVSCVFSAE